MPITGAFIALVVFVLVASLSVYGYSFVSGKDPGVVTSVVDGDTVWGNARDGGNINVRVIGIDTPETKHPNKPVEFWGPEASQNAEKKLLRHKVVFDYDGRKPKPDKYNRTLAYIKVDGKDYGFWAIWDGYAREENYGHKHKKQKLYKFAEFCAKVRGVGVWQDH